jgi:osmotically-inducible protein OsmY
MKTTIDDKLLQTEVLSELDFDPNVDSAHIGIAVTDGAVTLTGHVRSHPAKIAAVRAAERVYGVRAVANEIEVRRSATTVRDDTDIAQEIARLRTWNAQFPDAIEVEVANGHVTLRGEVGSAGEREEAEAAVRSLNGVRGIANWVTVEPKPTVEELQQRLDDRVSVSVDDSTVTLHGTVRTLAERRAAQRAAETAPGVSKVKNRIRVVPVAPRE